MNGRESISNGARMICDQLDTPYFHNYGRKERIEILNEILKYIYNEGFQNGKKIGFQNGLKAGQRETKQDIINKFKNFVEDENA